MEIGFNEKVISVMRQCELKMTSTRSSVPSVVSGITEINTRPTLTSVKRLLIAVCVVWRVIYLSAPRSALCLPLACLPRMLNNEENANIKITRCIIVAVLVGSLHPKKGVHWAEMTWKMCGREA